MCGRSLRRAPRRREPRVVPDACPLVQVAGADLAAWCASPKLKEAVVAQMQAKAKEMKVRDRCCRHDGRRLTARCARAPRWQCLRTLQLAGFEQVRDIHLTAEPFSVENGTLTPTFKLKRPQLTEMFRAQINSMYETS